MRWDWTAGRRTGYNLTRLDPELAAQRGHRRVAVCYCSLGDRTPVENPKHVPHTLEHVVAAELEDASSASPTGAGDWPTGLGIGPGRGLGLTTSTSSFGRARIRLSSPNRSSQTRKARSW